MPEPKMDIMSPYEEEEWNRRDIALNGSQAVITRVDYGPTHPSLRKAARSEQPAPKAVATPAPGRQS